MSQELVDEAVERTVICTLWEESRTFGAKRGLSLLSRTQLSVHDFDGKLAKHVFDRMLDSFSHGRAPTLHGEDPPACREFLATDELLAVSGLDAHAERLRWLSLRRNMRLSLRRINEAILGGKATSAELESLFIREAKGIPRRMDHFRTLSDAVRDVEKHVRNIADGKKQPSVLSGFPSIDEITGGFPSTLVVVAAMPGVGKSALLGAVLRNLAMRGEKSLTFCLEDRSDWLAFRLLAHESGVHQFVLRHKALSETQWDKFGSCIYTLDGYGGNILCDDRDALTPGEVLSTARYAVQECGARAIFLDNMSSMEFDDDGVKLQRQIQRFLRDARSLANEFDVPFVVLAHVKRREGLDVDKTPALADCADSAAYERFARVAYGLSRDKETSTLHLAVLKNTNGQPFFKVDLPIRPTSAIIDEEVKRAAQLELVPAPRERKEAVDADE